MRTEGQGNDGQGNETTRAGPLVGRCGLPGPSFLGSTFATPPPAPPRTQMPTACPWNCYVRRSPAALCESFRLPLIISLLFPLADVGRDLGRFQIPERVLAPVKAAHPGSGLRRRG